MRTSSLRRSLLIRCGTGIGVLLFILSTAIYFLVRQNMFHEVDQAIEQTASLLANQVELENEQITFEWREGLGSNFTLAQEGLFQFWDENTGATTRSPALGATDLPKFRGANGKPLLRSIQLPGGRHGRAIGLRIYPFVLQEEVVRMNQRGRVIDPKSMPYILVVARDTGIVNHTLQELSWVLAGGTVLTLIGGFILIGHVLRTTLKPINDLVSQVQDRAEHQLDRALDLPEALPNEFKVLAESFDTLLGRVAAIRDRERDFTRHAAHELRTPVAVLRATTELALSHAREPEQYRQLLSACHDTAIDLCELINRLSALARIGQTTPAKIETFDLGEKLHRSVETFANISVDRELTLHIQPAAGPMPVSGDLSLAKIILDNLFDNALCYTEKGGTVSGRFFETRHHFGVSISNPTQSPVENPERWFEPLFRSEPSRQDTGSHLGVGLALSLQAALAMGWTLTARSDQANTVEFVLRAPKAAKSSIIPRNS